ncbi:hypothetical protein WJX73_007409 [Symbiochloris irregularis]|uniref:glucose-6-phosphate 1-epimerase n=1 Tax=Symbiochloris irregularis TaxID=706552 RepID=A0AAW1P1A6_9CHLO
MEAVTVKSQTGATAQIYTHGAHLTSWISSSGEELIFVSKKAIFKPPKAIRGGIPVCFPQFGKLGPLGQHGFARNSTFTVSSQTDCSVTLKFRPTPEQLEEAKFAHRFELAVSVTLGTNDRGEDTLTQTLEATNMSDAAFDITAALHTYFTVSSIDQVQITGVDNKFLDNTQDMKESTSEPGPVTFSGEVDRIYVKTPDNLQIVDKGKRRTITLHKEGLPDAVVWNPWAEKAKAMADFDDEEYKGMVCLEPALAASGPISLQPQQQWHAQQVLSVSNT